MAKYDNITLAKVKLITSHPFFGSLAMRYPSSQKAGVYTMATDGKYIWYYEEWVNSLTKEEVVGVMAHEVMHIAFLHHLRRGDRDPVRWNIACDYAINVMLIDNGFKLPEGGLINEKYRGWTAEKIYNQPEIEEEAKRRQPCEWGMVEDSESVGDAAKTSMEEANIKVSVLQAAQSAKAHGKMPQGFDGLIDEYSKPSIDWEERMQTFIGGTNPDDWSYRRFNSIYAVYQGACVPMVDYKCPGEIVIGIDSSGSVSKVELSKFLGNLRHIHNELKPYKTHVVWCDTVIAHTQTYEADEEFDDKRRYACGGTNLAPVFKWVEDQGIQPDSLIFFTDLYIDHSDLAGIEPNYPVLWATTGSEEAPFGEVVKIPAD